MVNKMFNINKSTLDEVLENLEINLKKTASEISTVKEKKLVEAVELLNSSAEMLEQFGFEKEANLITQLTILAVQGDPHTEHLTTEKMVNNLKNKGIMFDANDGYKTKEYTPTHEGPDEYKREKLEEEYLEEMLDADYDKILGDLEDEYNGDEVII